MTSAGIRERLLSPSRRRPTAMAKVKLQSRPVVRRENRGRLLWVVLARSVGATAAIGTDGHPLSCQAALGSGREGADPATSGRWPLTAFR